MEESISNQEYGVYIAMLVLALVVIGVLSGVVLMQNRQIRDLKSPKFGFLGKPINLLLVGFFAFGLLSTYSFIKLTPDSNIQDTNADAKIEAHILYSNLGNNNFEFNFTPYVDDQPWHNQEGPFTIYWTFIKGTETTTDIEVGAGKTNASRLLKQLESGKYNVKATTFIGEREITKEVEIVVE